MNYNKSLSYSKIAILSFCLGITYLVSKLMVSDFLLISELLNCLSCYLFKQIKMLYKQSKT